MKIYSCRCGSTWTGLKPEHCTACCQTFAATYLGDAHRVGEHDEKRRCLTTTEMEAKGWRHLPCASGGLVWRGPEMSDEQKQLLYGTEVSK